MSELGAMLKPIRDFLTLRIPHTEPQTMARLHSLAQIVEQDYSGEQAHFRARIPPHVRHEFDRFVQEDGEPTSANAG
jgi:50S ribosomal subunit-associated GTPase HflX